MEWNLVEQAERLEVQDTELEESVLWLLLLDG
jgi:hypothetical protein